MTSPSINTNKFLVFSRLRHICVLMVIILLGVSESNAQLRVFYIRHAEGGHNVTGDWADVPEDQWPDYVGNSNMFTPLGEMQLIEATKNLQMYHFDFIGVSPLWRTRNTILPYLKETARKGEIWPELYEIYASSLILSDLPPPTVKILGEGAAIELPGEEVPYFILRADGLNKFKKPPFPPDHEDKEGETAVAQVVIQRVLDMIEERFSGSDTSILLVGHGSSGKGILRMLTGDLQENLRSIENTGIWMVEEQANGEFVPKLFNNLPVEFFNPDANIDSILAVLETGNTWYHHYSPIEINAPIISTSGGTLTTTAPSPSTALNLSPLVSQFLKDTGDQSYIKFRMPGEITNVGNAIFKARVYASSDNSSGNNTLQLVLRRDGLEATQLALKKEITESDKWIEYTFSFSEDTLKEEYYNDAYLFFPSQDTVNDAEGNVYYIDAFQGPDKEYKVTFSVKDLLADSLLQHTSVTVDQVQQLTDSKGETQFSLPRGNYNFRISHPIYEDIGSSLEVSQDTLVHFSMVPATFFIRFSLFSENMNPLPDISIMLGENEINTGTNGEAIFNLLAGNYHFTTSHPDYFTTSSSLFISADSTIDVFLVAKKANMKFRIYSEDKPLYNVDLHMEADSHTTNQTGIVLFEDFTRYEDYDWHASKEGYEDLTGTVSLMNDTIVNLTMSLFTTTENFAFKGITLYPNPVQTTLFIESEEKVRRIDICDLRAAVLCQEDINAKKASFDLSGYPDGIYIANIFRDGLRTVSLKVIKAEY